ncbi:hypothetical protein ACFLU2_00895 [Chloroflexota bacterium]
MKSMMQSPNLIDIFKATCSRDQGALKWGNPEPWVHAELFAEFNRRSGNSGWIPFKQEVPYLTYYPVQLPKPSNHDWKSIGAVKWIDLCLRSTDSDHWCWFEFKVRHIGLEERANKAALDARNAFCKDIVALLGFDTNATADEWRDPDSPTAAYWFESELRPHAEELRLGNHHFISAFLQLDGDLNDEIWNREALIKQVNAWKEQRCKHRGEVFRASDNLKISSNQVGNHWLISVEC